MVSAADDMPSSRFLDEAVQIGRSLVGGAIEHDGRATWLTDSYAFVDGRWQATVATLEGDLGAGTAGVGWVLARLAEIAGGDRALARGAVAAFRHSLARVPTLLGADRLDWYHGASGVAWAAIDAGRALDDAQLVAAGERAALAFVGAAASRPAERRDWSLVGGECGVIAGLLALAPLVDGDRATEVAARVAGAAADAVPDRLHAFEHDTSGAVPTGLARGLSGIGLVLSAAADAVGEADFRSAALRGFVSERAVLEPGVGWFTDDAHPWRPEQRVPASSWCRGAAGIGIARIAASTGHRDLPLLADATAAIELVRSRLAAGPDADASMCHGTSGVVELLLLAGSLLDEPAHTAAARRVGAAMVTAGRSGGRYGCGIAVGAHNPSLLHGLAGTAVVLARLHDPDAITSPALPPILSVPRHQMLGEVSGGTGGM